MREWVRRAWRMWRALGFAGAMVLCRRNGPRSAVRVFARATVRVESVPMTEAVRDVLVAHGLCAPRSADWHAWQANRRREGR